MMGENFFLQSFILPPTTSSSITKSVPEPVYASENRFLLCIYTSSLSPFSVHVSMECRFSDRGDLVAEATASFHHIHP